MRAADLSGGTVGCDALAPRRRIEPEPEIAPRVRYHPTPAFEPRKVYRTEPRFEVTWKSAHEPALLPCDAPKKCDPAHASVLAAPWRTPVWKMPIDPPAQVKVYVHRVDVHHKGSLIDLFL